MPQEEYQRLLYAKGPSWDELTTNDCTFDDLDKNRIRQVVRVAIAEGRLAEVVSRSSIKEILKKLDLCVERKAEKRSCHPVLQKRAKTIYSIDASNGTV